MTNNRYNSEFAYRKYRTPYTLNIKTLNGARTLSRGKWKQAWYDRDHILLHASFQILVDFMEKEKPGEVINWESDKSHKKAWKEMNRLYNWWTRERIERFGPCDVLYGDGDYKFSQYREKTAALAQAALEQHWDREDEKNLIALIRIRGFLWT